MWMPKGTGWLLLMAMLMAGQATAWWWLPSRQKAGSRQLSRPFDLAVFKQAIQQELLPNGTANCASYREGLTGCSQPGTTAVWHAGHHWQVQAATCSYTARHNTNQPIHTATIVIRQPNEQQDAPAYFRVRVVGPVVMEVPVESCGKGWHIAQAAVDLPGEYHAEVVRLYQSFSFNQLNSKQILTHISDFTWTTTHSNLGHHTAAVATQPQPAVPHQQPCLKYPVPGRWQSENSSYAKIQASWRTNLSAAGHRDLPRTWYNDSLLRWTPISCRLRTWPELARQGCLINRHVCFVGDSHIRNLHNGYVASLPSILQGYEEPGFAIAHPAGKEVLDSPHATFVWERMGDAAEVNQGNLSHCDTIVMNFGQWPLSRHAGRTPLTAARYEQLVTQRAKMLSGLQSRGKYALWMSTLPCPWHAWNTGSNPKDWRSQPWIKRFNSIANRVMAAHGVHLMDVFDMASTLVDLTFDGIHFSPNTTVGVAFNRYLTNYLCSLH